MNRTILASVGLALLLLLAGCVGGSPELQYQGQKFQEVNTNTGEIGYDGTIANNGDGAAENVSIVLTVELVNGDTYSDVAYLGTIEDGDSKEWEASIRVDEEDMQKEWDNADWTLEVRGDNFDNQPNNLNK